MKKSMYVQPRIEEFQLCVEQGFAATTGFVFFSEDGLDYRKGGVDTDGIDGFTDTY